MGERNPFEAMVAGDNPFSRYARPAKRKPDTVKDVGKSFVSGVVEGAAGLGDALIEALPQGQAIRYGLDAATAASRSARGDRRRSARAPGSRGAVSEFYSQFTHTPETDAGEWARTAGQMAPNALAPGSLVARTANVVVPTLTTEVAGRTARALGADQRGEAVARTAGGLIGALGTSVRPNALTQTAPEPAAALADRARLQPNALTMRAQELRAAGVDPTLTDVVGNSGRRVIRAVGVRSEAGGEALADRAAEAATTAKPAVMARARGMGPRPGETAEEVRTSLETVRDEAASTNYRPAYEAPVSVTSETLRALSGAPGRAAMREARRAAEARLDDAQVAEIDALIAGFDGGRPPTQLSAGTMDRLRIALREGAARAGQNNQGAYASGLRGRMDTVDQTLDTAPGLEPARADYRAKTQAIEVLDNGARDPFSTDPNDYRRWLEGLSPEAQEANQVAIRQNLLDTLGRQRSSGFGALDEIATSPYFRENLRAAFGPEEADTLIRETGARLEQARNAGFVSPNGGSRTAVLENDVGASAQDVVGAGRALMRGDILGLAARAADAWRRRGISEQQAEELARLAIDPAQTDEAIRAIAARLEPGARQQFLELRNAALVGGSVGATSLAGSEDSGQSR